MLDGLLLNGQRLHNALFGTRLTLQAFVFPALILFVCQARCKHASNGVASSQVVNMHGTSAAFCSTCFSTQPQALLFSLLARHAPPAQARPCLQLGRHADTQLEPQARPKALPGHSRQHSRWGWTACPQCHAFLPVAAAAAVKPASGPPPPQCCGGFGAAGRRHGAPGATHPSVGPATRRQPMLITPCGTWAASCCWCCSL